MELTVDNSNVVINSNIWQVVSVKLKLAVVLQLRQLVAEPEHVRHSGAHDGHTPVPAS